MIDKCPICGKYHQLFMRKCEPRWAVFVDGAEDPQSVFAQDESSAAEEVASEHDAGDYHLMNGGELTVRVCDWRTWENIADLESKDAISEAIANLPKWVVEGYAVPEYKATRVKEGAYAGS
jgi:hypothetical protein